MERQKQLFQEGKTKTLDSYHLKGRAVDICRHRGKTYHLELFFYEEWQNIF